MAIQLGTISYKFIADTSAFEAGIVKLQTNISKFGAASSKVGRNLTVGLTAPLVAFATAAIKAGLDVDDAMDRIRQATGATGARLEGLEKVWRGVFATVPATALETADAISALAARTNLAGPALQAMATQMLNLARVSGSEVEPLIASLTRTMGAWGVSANEQSASLDYLYRTTTTTGIGIDRLGELMTQHAVPLQQLGIGFEEAAALLGTFEKAGIATEPVLMSLKVALMKMAEEGIADPVAGLKTLIERIQQAGTASAANAIAIEAFGIRAGPYLADAARSGKLAVGDLVAQIAGGKDSINASAFATYSLTEKIQHLRNQAILALEPIGTQMIEALEKLMPVAERALQKVAGLALAFANLKPGAQEGILGFGLLLAAIGPLTYAIGGLATAIKWLVPVFGLITAPVAAVGLAVWDMVNQFKMVRDETGSWVLGMLAVMSPLFKVPILLWAKWPEFRQQVIDLWDGIVGYIKTVPVAIINCLLGLPGQVYDLFLSMATNAWNAFKEGLGIGSPSLVERAFTAIADTADAELARVESRMIQTSGNIGAATKTIGQDMGTMSDATIYAALEFESLAWRTTASMDTAGQDVKRLGGLVTLTMNAMADDAKAMTNRTEVEVVRYESILLRAAGSTRVAAAAITTALLAAGAAVARYSQEIVDAALGIVDFITTKLGLEFDIWVAKNDAVSGSVAYLKQQLESETAALTVLNAQIPAVAAQLELLRATKGADAEETRKLTIELLQLQKAQAETEKAIRDLNEALNNTNGIYEVLIENGQRYINIQGGAVAMKNAEGYIKEGVAIKALADTWQQWAVNRSHWTITKDPVTGEQLWTHTGPDPDVEEAQKGAKERRRLRDQEILAIANEEGISTAEAEAIYWQRYAEGRGIVGKFLKVPGGNKVGDQTPDIPDPREEAANAVNATLATLAYLTGETEKEWELWQLTVGETATAGQRLAQEIAYQEERLQELGAAIPDLEAGVKLVEQAFGADSEEARRLRLRLLDLIIEQADETRRLRVLLDRKIEEANVANAIAVPGMAAGGIVTRPTLTMLAEGGRPEAVIPLSSAGAAAIGSTINITITGNTIATDMDLDRICWALVKRLHAEGVVPG